MFVHTNIVNASGFDCGYKLLGQFVSLHGAAHI